MRSCERLYRTGFLPQSTVIGSMGVRVPPAAPMPLAVDPRSGLLSLMIQFDSGQGLQLKRRHFEERVGSSGGSSTWLLTKLSWVRAPPDPPFKGRKI